jgi:molybdopterin-guanine dinucleotide biosynthesis protein B
MTPLLFGVAGWKNSGKTTLMARLITEITRRGYKVAVLKHAHHSFDIDHPGRDSYKLREAGAAQVALSSPRRFALMRELGEGGELGFEQLLAYAGPCDLLLVEGFKREDFPKIEIRREGASSREPLKGKFPGIVAIASDRPENEGEGPPVFQLDDVQGITDFLLAHLGLGPT